jgi:hypothetical protein
VLGKLRNRRSESRLAAEAETFLAGGGREGWTPDRPMPPWMHINWLAHSTPSEIEERARAEWGLTRPSGSWGWAVSTVARELYVCSHGDDGLVLQLQRDCLIPMELSLMDPERREFLPEQLVALGVPRLHAHPRVRGTSP